MVLKVMVGDNGIVRSADVLQAPDQLTAIAARDAVLRWEFKPTKMPGQNEDRVIQSKVCLYFIWRQNRGTVLTPLKECSDCGK